MQDTQEFQEVMKYVSSIAKRLLENLEKQNKFNEPESEEKELVKPVSNHTIQIPKPRKLKEEPLKREKKTKKTYRAYSVELKQKLVDEIKSEATKSESSLYMIINSKAREHQIHPKNLTRWCQLVQIRKREAGRKPRFPELEERLANYVKLNPLAKRRTIIQNAKMILSEIDHPDKDSFVFSKGWYERFKTRHFSGQESIEKCEKSLFIKEEEEDGIKQEEEEVSLSETTPKDIEILKIKEEEE